MRVCAPRERDVNVRVGTGGGFMGFRRTRHTEPSSAVSEVLVYVVSRFGGRFPQQGCWSGRQPVLLKQIWNSHSRTVSRSEEDLGGGFFFRCSLFANFHAPRQFVFC